MSIAVDLDGLTHLGPGAYPSMAGTQPGEVLTVPVAGPPTPEVIELFNHILSET